MILLKQDTCLNALSIPTHPKTQKARNPTTPDSLEAAPDFS